MRFLFLIIFFTNFLYSNALNYIVVETGSYSLKVYDFKDKLINSYPIGIGENGIYKTSEGDKKTPIGDYEILWKASVFFDEDGGYPILENLGFISKDNVYHLIMEEEDSALYDKAFGGEMSIFMSINYPNASDIKKGYTGNCIAIHATKLGGIGEKASLGCIRMNPKDAKDLANSLLSGKAPKLPSSKGDTGER